MKAFNIRPAKPLDISFIFETWLKSYKHDSAFGKSTRSYIFFPQYRQVLDSILSDQTTQVFIACHPEVEDVILGYLVVSKDVIHYVFVKESFRNIGIARELYNHVGGPLILSHRTNFIQPILDKHTELVYNPFTLFNKGE